MCILSLECRNLARNTPPAGSKTDDTEVNLQVTTSSAGTTLPTTKGKTAHTYNTCKFAEISMYFFSA